MTEPNPSPLTPPWGRLAVTLGLVGLTVVLPLLHVDLPGVDTSAIESQSSLNLSVFALGIMPLLSAMLLVELFAAAIPPWRPLRHGGPAGRAVLGRVTLIVTAALCALQGFGVAQLLLSLGVLTAPGLSSLLMVMVSLAAGTFLLVLLAQIAGARGLVGGLAVMLVGTQLVGHGQALATLYVTGQLEVGPLAVPAAGVALTIAATWLVLRAPPAAPGLAPVPAPAGGVVALSIVGAVLATAASLAHLAGRELPLFPSEPSRHVVTLLLIVVLGVALTWIFNAPSRVAGLAVRAGDEGGAAVLEGEARRGLREAALRSVVYLVALFAIGRVTRDSLSAADLTFVAVVTALVLDAAAEWRARRTLPDLVPVWPEHRPYALASARAALARAGIAVHARGENLRRLLQFGGPFVPIDLLVSRADAERAGGILDALLRFHAEDQPVRAPRPAQPRRWTRLEGQLLAAAVVLGGAALLLPGARAPQLRLQAPARPAALQILPVDDDDDSSIPPPAALPSGVSILPENVPLGPERSALHHYARIVAAHGESLDQARARLLAWAEPPAASRARYVRAQAVSEYDEAKDTSEQIGWRTFLVEGGAVIDGSDVQGAQAQPDGAGPADHGGWHVVIELGPAGAERFRAFTASHVRRRLAILVDGRVESAPFDPERDWRRPPRDHPGTRLPEEQAVEAKRLEATLLGR